MWKRDPIRQRVVEKLSKLLEYRQSFSCYSVIRKDERECLKNEKIRQSAAKSSAVGGGKVQRL